MDRRRKYTPEQREFLITNYQGRTRQELTDIFNEQFGLKYTRAQISEFMYRNKLRNGHIWSSSRFQKGCKHHHLCRPIGAERIKDDIVKVKVANPDIWRNKHVVIWEAAYGAVPKGHVVIFGDGNRRNFALDNLVLISQRELAILNGKRLRGATADLTRTGIIIADIHLKIADLWKQNNITDKTPQLSKVQIPKSVIRLNDNKIYPSLRAAAKDIGGHHDAINRVCNGRRGHCKGYRFRYLE